MILTAEIDGFAIHGGGNGVALTSIEVGSPQPRQVVGSRPWQHGASDATRFYGPRLIALTGSIQAASLAELWQLLDDLKGSLALGSERTLTFERDGLGYAETIVVRVDSPVDVPITAGMVQPYLAWGVSLLAPDPRFYGPQSSGSYDPTTTGDGGLVFSLDFPLVFEGDGSATLTVTNEGNIETPPVFTITGPVVNPIIDNDSTGESIYTTGLDLDTGDTVVIDVAARQVLLGGTTNRPDLIDSSTTTWFDLQPGSNQLRLRGTGMSATETELAVSFNPARI